VQISGTERSTRAAKLALVIAKATECQISVLSIREPQQIRSLPGVSGASNPHVAAFNRIDDIALYKGVTVRKIVQEGSAPELAHPEPCAQGRLQSYRTRRQPAGGRADILWHDCRHIAGNRRSVIRLLRNRVNP